jgi:hypothetical protein
MDGGLGSTRTADDSRWGAVEILDLIPALSTMAAERAIRTRATAFAESGSVQSGGPIAAVLDIRRVHDSLSVFSPDPAGVSVLDLLAATEQGTLELNDEAILDLACAVVRAVAWLHARPGSLAHGALSPAHVVLGREGAITLTEAVFATALQTLPWNRERFWRECGLTLPTAATPPQFDQRADVVEMGGVVLAILLRRPLRVDEYTAIPELVMEATARGPMASVVRVWLQQTLHLHPKLTFASAVEAWAMLAALNDPARPLARSRSVLRQVISGRAHSSLVASSDFRRPRH